MIRRRVREYTNMLTDQPTMANGCKTRSGEEDMKFGQTEIFSPENTLKAKKKAWGNSNGPIKAPSKGTTMLTGWTATESIATAKANMLGNGRWT